MRIAFPSERGVTDEGEESLASMLDLFNSELFFLAELKSDFFAAGENILQFTRLPD